MGFNKITDKCITCEHFYSEKEEYFDASEELNGMLRRRFVESCGLDFEQRPCEHSACTKGDCA